MSHALLTVLGIGALLGVAGLYLWAFIDCGYHEEPPSRRVGWLLALLLLSWIGLVAYLINGEHRRRMGRAFRNWWRTGVPSTDEPTPDVTKPSEPQGTEE